MGLTQITTGGVDDNINIDSNTLKVDGTNNLVGIGTSSPGTKLDILGGSDASVILTVNGADASSEYLGLGINAGAAVITAGGNGSTSNALVFKTAPSGTETERMRIDSSGRLLLGTTTEGEATADNLTIADSGHCGITLRSGTSSVGTIFFSDATSGTAEYQGYVQYDHSGNYLKWATAATERMRIDSSGNLTAYSGSTNGNYFVIRGKHSPGNEYNRSEVRFGVENNANGLGFLAFATGNNTASERLRIDSSGNVGIGTSSPSHGLLTLSQSASSAFNALVIQQGNTGSAATDGLHIGIDSAVDAYITHKENRALAFGTANTERMRIDSSGKVLVATTSPSNYADRQLTVGDTSLSSSNIEIRCASNGFGGLTFSDSTASDVNSYRGTIEYGHSTNHMQFRTDAVERMRIDSSGRLIIGTSADVSGGDNDVKLQVASSSGPSIQLCRTDSTTTANELLGRIFASTEDGGTSQVCGQITFRAEGSHTINDHATRMEFSTCPDQGSSAIERMRIDSSGNFMVGKTATGGDNNGAELRGGSGNYAGLFTAHNHTVMFVNRKTNDGDLVIFRQDNNNEGSISVSGSTVSYNGAHLSRWSQLAGGAARTEILRGSVLSNLDEMCEWGEENNEQLNRMKVSDVEGDVNVSGVFQAWDDDDDTYVNDFYCAMTGDFVIRIAQGTTVARGDLLMSAGDGTAKPQDDDIVRSKTIAKVTSTTVSETYSDNSYCVPCVLMAC